jgi:hypothetical protein
MHQDYPFVSPCGKEINFILPADMPIVFHDLDTKEGRLVYGGSLSVSFDPSQIHMSMRTGRLYHPSGRKHAPFGLIRSQIAVTFIDHITLSDDSGEAPALFSWQGQSFPVHSLPDEHEPLYGLPPMEEED